MIDSNNGYHIEIDPDKPIRDSLYDIAKALDHLPAEKHPFSGVLILCYEKESNEVDFLPYVMGDIDDEDVSRLLLSTLYNQMLGD